MGGVRGDRRRGHPRPARARPPAPSDATLARLWDRVSSFTGVLLRGDDQGDFLEGPDGQRVDASGGFPLLRAGAPPRDPLAFGFAWGVHAWRTAPRRVPTVAMAPLDLGDIEPFAEGIAAKRGDDPIDVAAEVKEAIQMAVQASWPDVWAALPEELKASLTAEVKQMLEEIGFEID